MNRGGSRRDTLSEGGGLASPPPVQVSSTCGAAWGSREEVAVAAGAQVGENASKDTIQKYWYTDLGDLHCVTKKERASFDCANPASTVLANERLQMYAFDALERLVSSRTFNPSGSGAVVVRATYDYDGLDRPVQTRECHKQTDCRAAKWWEAGRQTTLGHVGSSSQVAREAITGADSQSKTKRYSYDPYGGRNAVEVTNTSDQTANYTYAYDAHGSVGLLVTDERSVQASYGYDPYGGEDEKLTKELKQGSGSLVTPATDPLNAYRYTGHREDTGSGMIDMGARRFSPDTARFMSSDFYAGALADIGLSTDPLTQNRYVLAAGNPVSFVELDGHAPDKSDVQSGFRSRSDPRAKKESRAQDADWEKLTNAWHRSTKNQRGERGAIPAETPSEAGGFLNALSSIESRVPDPGGLRRHTKCAVGAAVDTDAGKAASCVGDAARDAAKSYVLRNPALSAGYLAQHYGTVSVGGCLGGCGALALHRGHLYWETGPVGARGVTFAWSPGKPVEGVQMAGVACEGTPVSACVGARWDAHDRFNRNFQMQIGLSIFGPPVGGSFGPVYTKKLY
jgi:RHS repeat-associated protein